MSCWHYAHRNKGGTWGNLPCKILLLMDRGEIIQFVKSQLFYVGHGHIWRHANFLRKGFIAVKMSQTFTTLVTENPKVNLIRCSSQGWWIWFKFEHAKLIHHCPCGPWCNHRGSHVRTGCGMNGKWKERLKWVVFNKLLFTLPPKAAIFYVEAKCEDNDDSSILHLHW